MIDLISGAIVSGVKIIASVIAVVMALYNWIQALTMIPLNSGQEATQQLMLVHGTIWVSVLFLGAILVALENIHSALTKIKSLPQF
ncbi:MAG TPA: hypothetical protein VK558_07860 [Patescibacteria group bacterium]|nr:hypothetical protein [Patescibacteria group bacterium]